MNLYLLRHAKSSWESCEDDHNRVLSERGRNDASTLGKYLHKNSINFEIKLRYFEDKVFCWDLFKYINSAKYMRKQLYSYNVFLSKLVSSIKTFLQNKVNVSFNTETGVGKNHWMTGNMVFALSIILLIYLLVLLF